MTYRSEDDALRARRLSLQSEIEALGLRARELPYLELRKREVQRELASLRDPDAKPPPPPRNWRWLFWTAGGLAMALTAVGALSLEFRKVGIEGNGQRTADLATPADLDAPGNISGVVVERDLPWSAYGRRSQLDLTKRA